MIISSIRFFFKKERFSVPPPSKSIVLIPFFDKIDSNFVMFTWFFPQTITSRGNFCNRFRFGFDIISDVTIIVGTRLHVLIILELFLIVPWESRIILIGFFPLAYLTVKSGSSCSTVFLPTSMASDFERSLWTVSYTHLTLPTIYSV